MRSCSSHTPRVWWASSETNSYPHALCQKVKDRDRLSRKSMKLRRGRVKVLGPEFGLQQ
jgi:hypothetical protein